VDDDIVGTPAPDRESDFVIVHELEEADDCVPGVIGGTNL
jgi:hypothetical protein